jgi:hypothetical protein
MLQLEPMRYVRSLLASLLLAGVTGVGVSSAHAASQSAPAAADTPAPEVVQAYAPLSAVAIMLQTGQALVYDEQSGKYRVVMVGDVVADWKVVAIEESSVLVLHGEERDVLGLVPPPRPIEGVHLPKNTPYVQAPQVISPPSPTIVTPAPAPVAKPKPAAVADDATVPHKLTRQELNRELGDFDRLGAAVDVAIAPGGGFRLTRVDRASWPYRMGLRQGDVIRSVAGERVASIEDAARVYARLRSSKAFAIEVDRPMDGVVDDGDPPTTRVVLQYHVK